MTIEQSQSLNVLLTDQGIVLDIDDGKNSHQVVLSSDDAGRLAVTLIQQSTIHQFTQIMKRAQEQAEFEKVRRLVDKSPDIIIPK